MRSHTDFFNTEGTLIKRPPIKSHSNLETANFNANWTPYPKERKSYLILLLCKTEGVSCAPLIILHVLIPFSGPFVSDMSTDQIERNNLLPITRVYPALSSQHSRMQVCSRTIITSDQRELEPTLLFYGHTAPESHSHHGLCPPVARNLPTPAQLLLISG